MTNLEHIIENTLIRFENGEGGERIFESINEDINFNEQPLTVEQIYEICQYVWCTYLDNGYRIKDNKKMTNAEKLAKDTHFMRNACLHYDCSNHYCNVCQLYGLNEAGNYYECKRDDAKIDEWLESEVEEE